MPPKQPPKHQSSQASSSHHAAGPTHSYYEICEHIADHLRNEFSVGREMSAVIETEKGGSHPSVTLWVQARRSSGPRSNTEEFVGCSTTSGRSTKYNDWSDADSLINLSGAGLFLPTTWTSQTRALFQFGQNKDKNKTDKLPTGGFHYPSPSLLM